MTASGQMFFCEPGTFSVCIDTFTSGVARGTFYNSFVEGHHDFSDLMGFLQAADRVMDAAAFPQAYYRRRGFCVPVLAGDGVEIAERRRRLRRCRPPKEFTGLRGRCGTFWINVLYRRGGSWQGVATWFPPKGHTLELTFRSVLELTLAMTEVLQRQMDEQRSTE